MLFAKLHRFGDIQSLAHFCNTRVPRHSLGRHLRDPSRSYKFLHGHTRKRHLRKKSGHFTRRIDKFIGLGLQLGGHFFFRCADTQDLKSGLVVLEGLHWLGNVG